MLYFNTLRICAKNNAKKLAEKFAHLVENLYLCIAFEKKGHSFGRLAQLVQSICLTSRGSAVRIRQLPHHKLSDFSDSFFCFLYVSLRGATMFHIVCASRALVLMQASALLL